MREKERERKREIEKEHLFVSRENYSGVTSLKFFLTLIESTSKKYKIKLVFFVLFGTFVHYYVFIR